MNLIVDATVVTADGVIYNLTPQIFTEKRLYPPALIPAREPRGAEVVVLMNIVAFSAAIIWVKSLVRFP